MTKDLMINSNNINSIISKASDIQLKFKTIDDKSLAEISSWMPEVNRAVSCFNKQNSQTTSSLMSLNMIDSGPYRMLRQILAQAETKRVTLKDVLYKLEVKKLRHRKLEISKTDINEDSIEYEEIELKQNKISYDIVDNQGHIEAVLKELGALKHRYEEICKNKNIPENWDEQDFEAAEIEHHIKSIFRNAIRDRLQGSHNMGTMEYMEQFGINPITAYKFVDKYINEIKKEDAIMSIDTHYQFYNNMFDIFKDEYKKAMVNIGLDSITQADFLMRESK